jgi:AcrR family transcriptional regulator
MKAKKEIIAGPSAEERIKTAARLVFMEKGYAATRTRDIADASGQNLALINYYFRSKENLFDIIMVENMQLFLHSVADILNDKNTTLQQKLTVLINHYINMLIKNPQMPLFILNEINTNPQKLVEKIGLSMSAKDFYITEQWQEAVAKNKITINPVHVVMNIMGMTVFPFMSGPLMRNRTGMNMQQFNQLMEERKKLIPLWIAAIVRSSMI